MDENPPVQTDMVTEGVPATAIPPQADAVAPTPTVEDVDARIQATEPDELDARIGEALTGVIESATTPIPPGRYTENRQGTFLIDVDGVPVPVRMSANFEVSLWIESREEYPLVVRTYINTLRDQIVKKSQVLSNHFRERFTKQFRREIVAHSVQNALDANLTPEQRATIVSSGRFDRIVDTVLQLQNDRMEEANRQDAQREQERQAERQRQLDQVAQNAQPALDQGLVTQIGENEFQVSNAPVLNISNTTVPPLPTPDPTDTPPATLTTAPARLPEGE